MKKNLALKYRAIMSIICSLILFCLPVGAYMANGIHTMPVFASSTGTVAEDTTTENNTAENPETTAATLGDQEAESSTSGGDVNPEDKVEPSQGEEQTEQPTEEMKKTECICTEKCSQYAVNQECEHCKDNYTKCEYRNPNVVIGIKTPDGWYNSSAKVRVSVEDKLDTGNFVVAKIEAKIGQSGSWTDITDDRVIEISENCSVYVRVTDQKGIEYEKNRAIKCFDRTKPTLNAAVNDGSLSVQASDTDSGVKAIYVNGYEFTELTNGTLNIRLQQFDSGYQYFTIQALDHAGNLSEVYKTQNPYYKDPAKEDDGSGSNPAARLPVNAQATAPSSATANVTEHVKTDGNGNAITDKKQTGSTQNLSPAEQKKKAMAEADAADQEANEESEQGKEFYTIQTASEKVFYLIIDRDGEEEKVYFLTEISENDLLNTVDSTSDTLPMNSAALDNGIPTDSALPNNNVEVSENTTEPAVEEVTEETEETEEEPVKEEKKPIKESTFGTYILFGVLGAGVIAAAYFLKIKKKKEDFLDEDDDTEEEAEVFENEDEENVDDFFDQDESMEDAAPQTSEDDATETIDDEDEED